MKPSTAFNPQTALAILLVGEPKSGKTNLAFAFPSLGIIDWDLNLASAFRRINGLAFKYDQPAMKDDGTVRDSKDQWNAAVVSTKELIKDPEVKTIFVDGLGLMVGALCEHIINEGKKSGAHKTDKMEIQDYGELLRILRAYIMMVRSSGKTLLVSSHQTGDKDETTGQIRYVLAIPGQSKDTLGGYFTDVWATMARAVGLSNKYEIRTKPTGLHVALGASFPIDAAIDVTDKTPQQIWSIIGPKINAK